QQLDRLGLVGDVAADLLLGPLAFRLLFLPFDATRLVGLAQLGQRRLGGLLDAALLGDLAAQLLLGLLPLGPPPLQLAAQVVTVLLGLCLAQVVVLLAEPPPLGLPFLAVPFVLAAQLLLRQLLLGQLVLHDGLRLQDAGQPAFDLLHLLLVVAAQVLRELLLQPQLLLQLLPQRHVFQDADQTEVPAVLRPQRRRPQLGPANSAVRVAETDLRGVRLLLPGGRLPFRRELLVFGVDEADPAVAQAVLRPEAGDGRADRVAVAAPAVAVEHDDAGRQRRGHRPQRVGGRGVRRAGLRPKDHERAGRRPA